MAKILVTGYLLERSGNPDLSGILETGKTILEVEAEVKDERSI